MIEVVWLRGAEDDLQLAFNRYEDAWEGLGRRFYKELSDGIATLRTFPESSPVFSAPFRRLLIPRFRHGVFYTVEGSRF